jgi:glucose-6-phosphate dehydrogenase assembly protein OpcA
MSATLPAVCPELGTEVAVSEIDKELRKLWEKDEARTNASLMNLVVYSEATDGLLRNSAIIRDLTREHACRAILVEIDRSVPEPGLRAWITAHCHLAQGTKSVCCEQIAFHLSGRVTGRFRNTVFAHLNSDLPLVFWWQGELSDVFTERLVSVMNRLIIDSSGWRDPAAGFRKIDEATQMNRELVLQDLAWTRSWQFRVGLAGLFDDPIAQAALPGLRGGRIVHHPQHRNSALQLAAWLSLQARWQPVGRDGESFQFESKSGLKTIRLEADEASAPLGRLELEAENLAVRVCREAGAAHVLREIETADYLANSLSPADPDDAAQLVALQLSRGGKNSLFQKILPRFRDFLA